jgi:hypothetical protein
MRRPPVLNSRCWRLVNDQREMAKGRTLPAHAAGVLATLTREGEQPRSEITPQDPVRP